MMARTCRLDRGAVAVDAEWCLDGNTLLLTPEGSPAEAYPLGELAGIGGDSFTVSLGTGETALMLSRLGAEGDNLLADLRKAWLVARPHALRLAGTGEPRCFHASCRLPGGQPCPATLLLFEDVVLTAPEGADLVPLFLALVENVVLDDSGYLVCCHTWDGASWEFGKLAGQTEEFVAALQRAKGRLAVEAGEALGTTLPMLAVAARAGLASRWLPGRVMDIGAIEALATGAAQALRQGWIAALPRRAEAEALLDWADQVFLGYARPGVPLPASAVEEQAEGGAGAAADPTETPAVVAEPSFVAAPLWLLARKGSRWLIEFLSASGWATYCFEGGPEMIELTSQLLCAPQFSREALYLPIEKLIGDRAPLGLAARDLGFLKTLRECFRGRIIHSSHEAWRAALGI